MYILTLFSSFSLADGIVCCILYSNMRLSILFSQDFYAPMVSINVLLSSISNLLINIKKASEQMIIVYLSLCVSKVFKYKSSLVAGGCRVLLECFLRGNDASPPVWNVWRLGLTSWPAWVRFLGRFFKVRTTSVGLAVKAWMTFLWSQPTFIRQRESGNVKRRQTNRN